MTNEPKAWQFDPNQPYFRIEHHGVVVGFCTPESAGRIVIALNDEEKLRKALQLACLDLLVRSGGDAGNVEQLVKKYLAKAERPKYGPRAIAALLRDRQEELDVSDQEFAKFCDSYRLSVDELKGIYTGKLVSNNMLGPLARILGKSIEELVEIRDGASRPGDR